MIRATLWLCLLSSIGVSSFVAAASAAATTDVGPTISVDEVKPGMTGYGLTVFEGTKPERFNVRVVSVMHNFLPKQDLILIRTDDPRLVHSGIAQGMSGSPIYLDNRLAGALAYGWGFSKDPLAGVTPIASMQKELERELRNPQDSRPRVTVAPVGEGPRPAAIPLSVSGMTADAVTELGEQLAPYHLVPQQTGGAGRRGKPSKTAPRFEPGSSISVELIRGDISAVGTGTVTAIAGDRLLAFGHPMFSAGEIAFPIATSVVHTFMASLSTSFKLASPLEEAGALFQDRQSCIVGDMSRRVSMIPMVVTIRGAGRKEQKISVEVARHRFLTSTLVSSVLGSSASSQAGDIADATVTLRSKLWIHGEKPLELVDHVYAPDGVSARTLSSAQAVRAISELLFNAFTPVTIDRIELEADITYQADVAEITEASLGAETVEPGARLGLRVTLRPYGKPEESVVVPLSIPESLAGQTVKVTVQSGAAARPDLAPPENLHELVENLRRGYSSRALVVSLEQPDEGLTLHGKIVPQLPGSVLDSLRPSTAARRSDTLKHVSREIVEVPFVTIGKQELTVRVRERR